MREARCLQSNNTREARSKTYSTSVHPRTKTAHIQTQLRRLPWVAFDPTGPRPSIPTPDPSLLLRPYGTFVSSARIVKDSRTLQ